MDEKSGFAIILYNIKYRAKSKQKKNEIVSLIRIN